MPAGTVVGKECVGGDELTTGVIPRDFESRRILCAQPELLSQEASYFTQPGGCRITASTGGSFTVCALLLRCYTVTSFRFNS